MASTRATSTLASLRNVSKPLTKTNHHPHLPSPGVACCPVVRRQKWNLRWNVEDRRTSALCHTKHPDAWQPRWRHELGAAVERSPFTSAIMASVVSIRLATEAAFCRALRTTLVGSMMPAARRSS